MSRGGPSVNRFEDEHEEFLAALLGLAALEGIASAQTSPARIAYDVCYDHRRGLTSAIRNEESL